MSAPARRRRSTAAAIALTAGITASAALRPVGLRSRGRRRHRHRHRGPVQRPRPDLAEREHGTSASTGTSTGGSGSGKGSGGSAQPVTSARPAAGTTPRNGTAHNGLTISDGTRYVVMNGTRVDFGTAVRDLSWSPDGSKAAFIDGDGDLVVSNPDGSGRVVVAKNPGGQNWSHPTWQVRPARQQHRLPGGQQPDLLGPPAAPRGWSKLYGVPATAPPRQPLRPEPRVRRGRRGAAADRQRLAERGGKSRHVRLRQPDHRRRLHPRRLPAPAGRRADRQGSEPALSTGRRRPGHRLRPLGRRPRPPLPSSTPPTTARRTRTSPRTPPPTTPSRPGRPTAGPSPPAPRSGVVTLPADGSHAPVQGLRLPRACPPTALLIPVARRSRPASSARSSSRCASAVSCGRNSTTSRKRNSTCVGGHRELVVREARPPPPSRRAPRPARHARSCRPGSARPARGGRWAGPDTGRPSRRRACTPGVPGPPGSARDCGTGARRPSASPIAALSAAPTTRHTGPRGISSPHTEHSRSRAQSALRP